MTDRLITIGASHYCEKARWAVQRAGLPFREECHPPLFHIFVARRLGGRRTVPILIRSAETLTDSTDILKRVDELSPARIRLYPDDPERRRQVEQLEDRYDDDLGPAVRRVVYFHLLDHRTAYPILAGGVRPLERALFRITFPLCRAMIRKGLNVDEAGTNRSRAKLETVFAEVAALLADGRPYLTGDRFTAADLSFAALAAPLLFPPEYGHALPPLETMPDGYRQEIARCRSTPAGAFVLRLYAEERGTR